MTLWRDTTRGDWCYAIKFQKKRYGGRGFKTKGEARDAQEDRRKLLKKPPEPEPIRTDTDFETVASKYLDECEKCLARKTYEYKCMVYAEFISKQGNPEITDITPGMIRDYLNTRPTDHNFNVHRKELSALFSDAVSVQKVLTENPVSEVRKRPESHKRKSPPTKEEFLKIFMSANSEQRSLLVILAHTLGRISEILKLKWEDVNFHNKVVTLWTMKRKDGDLEPRYIPMNKHLYRALWPMWERRIQDEYVFWNLNKNNPGMEPSPYHRRPKMMKSLCKRANIRHYGFHQIRHFMATYMHDRLKIGTGPIGGVLGHMSKKTTEIYLHPVDEGMRHAMSLLGDDFDEILVAPYGCTFDEKGEQSEGLE